MLLRGLLVVTTASSKQMGTFGALLQKYGTVLVSTRALATVGFPGPYEGESLQHPVQR